jgi:hypothetical protein
VGAHRRGGHRRRNARGGWGHSRRLILAGVGGLVVALLLAGAAVLLLPGGAAAPAAAVEAPPPAGQTTTLVVLGEPGHPALGAALLGVGGASSLLTLPMHVVTAVPGQGTEPLGRALATSDLRAGEAAIEDMLGIRVDAGIKLSPAAFASLIDRTGGVTVDVDATVRSGHDFLATPGPAQHLRGTVASTYAGMLGGAEKETARLPRFSKVLVALLEQLPASAGANVRLLAQLGDGVATDSSFNGPAQSFAAAHAAVRGDALWEGALPVRPLGSGEYEYGVDAAGASKTAAAHFAAARNPADPGAPTVYVVNGVGGSGGSVLAVRDRLRAEGLSYAGSRNATKLGQRTSRVLIPEGTADAIAAGQRVARALGMRQSSVAVDPLGQRLADVMVLVGSDWRP